MTSSVSDIVSNSHIKTESDLIADLCINVDAVIAWHKNSFSDISEAKSS